MIATIQQENKLTKTIRELLGQEGEFLVGESLGQAKAVEPPDLPLLVENMQPKQPESVIEPQAETIDLSEFGSPISRFFSRDFVRYPLIFLLAFGFFYAVLNFQAVQQQISSWSISLIKNETQTAIQNSPEYDKWIKKYYVHVNDLEILLPASDPDNDYLTNREEYYLGTNPLNSDTDQDSYPDGREILNGYNPLYDGKLTANQQKIVASYIDRTSVESRQNLERVAGEKSQGIPDRFQIDPSLHGNITIPKININAPIIWSNDMSRMEEDLKYGTAHHPGTPYPGERGTASIHGHSSGNPWDGNFKTVFTKLNFLEPGDEVFVTVYGTRSEVRRYQYVVRSKKIFAKDDSAQFADQGSYFLNLSTSWPVGTARDRYVVTTELVGVNN